MTTNKLLALGLTASLTLAGCASNGSSGLSNTQSGALIGAASGALVGLLAKDKKKGALIGAVGGGIAGAAVGVYMDKQKSDLDKVLKEERESGAISVKKLDNDLLLVSMTSQTSFSSGSTEIKPGFESTMNKIANIVSQYEKTELQVIGHTDSQGSEASNQQLSEDRAQSVTNYLTSKGVISERLSWLGQGESSPIASNDDDDGRSTNRRIEIIVVPIVEETTEENI